MEGTPGALNIPGPDLGPTETLTDWAWPGPMEGMQWDLVVEQDVTARGPLDAPTGGYYWSHAFSFEQGVAGRVGIQSEGVYQADPPTSPIEIAKMAVYWLSGPPLAAELGDIPYPDARVAEVSIGGTDWLTIHARFDWLECHIYRMRFAPHSTDDAGNIWYGTWIDDITDGVEVFLGRMLLSSEAGALSPFTTLRTTPIDFVPVEACDVTTPVSALFGTPTTTDGQVPTDHTNRFSSEPRCGTSRFTEFPGAVRHELAVVP